VLRILIPEFLDFAGYRIYRAAITPENPWEKIFECGGTTGVPLTYSFDDSNLVMGFSYYYAVAAYDDGSQNFLNPGISLESSRMTSSAYLEASSSLEPEDSYADIKKNLRVVPTLTISAHLTMVIQIMQAVLRIIRFFLSDYPVNVKFAFIQWPAILSR
jgi:hypothetical protein